MYNKGGRLISLSAPSLSKFSGYSKVFSIISVFRPSR